MKMFLAAALVLLAIKSFAGSYLILENGTTITMDNSGFIYDFGHFAYPSKVTHKGGQFFIEENSILATIDESGYLYRKYEAIPEKITGKGINYFLSSEGELFTFDRTGKVAVVKEEELKSATNFGGNYFVSASDLWSVTADGKHQKITPEGFKSSDIIAWGGTYFMNKRGVLYVVSADGQLYPQLEVRVGIIGKKGGNYFTDSSGMLFTVSEDGLVKMPALPISLRVENITKLGSNYFLDLTGKLYVVDRAGNVFERSSRDHDLRHARIISL
jgi:hypothetical protein